MKEEHINDHKNEMSLREQITDKHHIHLHEGAMELTVLAFLKKVVEENKMDDEK